jgi:hypothetical protein
MTESNHNPYIIIGHTDRLQNISPGKQVICLHCPYPYNPKFEHLIDSYGNSQIVVIVTELHADSADFIRRYDRVNISYFLCGFLNFELKHSPVHRFMDWFITTLDFYQTRRGDLLLSLQPHKPKPLYFDALLGRKKLHRDLAYNFIQSHIANFGVTTYINNHHLDVGPTDSKKWIWENDGVTVSAVPKFTVEYVDYYGMNVRLSQIVPLSVYNQTAYSLIAETNFHNNYVFFTEKTVKPILGRRLFIMLGNRFSLRRLKELGFKTFSDIIDESYDDVELVEQRMNKALEQLEWLCRQPQEKILEQCLPIVEHNYNHMMTTDWYRLFQDQYKNYFL